MEDFGIDLVEEARAGRVPRAHGMERVVDALWETVHRDEGSRSAVLLGASGVGKSAAIGELAHRLLAEDDEWRILRIGSGDFMRGTKYLGEWETRAMQVVEECRRPARTILHMTDLPVLHTVGKAEKSDSNLATLMAPFLETGALSMLGEATPEAFADGLGSVPNLRRPFVPVQVAPTDGPGTLAVLRSWARALEEDVPEATLERIVELADLYGTSTAQPGRAVELFKRTLELGGERPLRPRAALEALSRTSGLPTELLDDELPLDLNQVADFFQRRVMGQPEALDAVRDTVTLLKAGLNDPRRPLGVMLFVGPTGVGKTELARALAEYLFGSPDRLLRFDLSEYASYQSYERLIGTRGGADGLLTSVVRERPFSVVLLDEIEKAHQNVFDLCLQLFDAGRLTDGAGRTVDFRRTIVILTSNVGSAVKTERTVGFGGDDGPRAPGADDVRLELERFFRPEFLNRIDRIVQFRPLDLETAEQIARRELHAVLGRSGIVRRGLKVDVDPALVQLLLERGYSAAFGARPLERTVAQLVLLPLARVLARSPHLGDEMLHLTAKHGEVVVRLVRETEDEEQPMRLVRVPRRTAPPRVEESQTLEQARASAAANVERAEGLAARAADLRGRREELVAESAAGDFWNDRRRALVSLDQLHRCDHLLEEIDRLVERARRQAERTLRSTKLRDVLAVADGIEESAQRASQLEHLLALDPDTALSDALIRLQSMREGAQSASFDGVARIGRMLSSWARRRGYEVRVLHDRCGGTPFEDSAVLAVDGPGAWELLRTESGLHRLRGYTEQTARSRRRTERETVKVEVFEAPTSTDDVVADVAIETRSLREPHGRFDARPRVAATLTHRPSRTRHELWFPGSADGVEEHLLPLVAACLGAAPASDLDVVRRYDFDPEPRVRDAATKLASPALSRVLEGDIDRFLLPGTAAD